MNISIHSAVIMIEVPVQRHRVIQETRFLVGFHIMYNNYEWKRVFDAPNSYDFVNAFNECIPNIIEIVNNLAQVCGYTLDDITLTVHTDNPYIVRLMNIYRRLEREKREKIMNDIYNETN